MFQFSDGLRLNKLFLLCFKYSNNEFHLCFKYFNDEFQFRSGRVYSEE